MQQSFWNTHYQRFDVQQPSSFSHYCGTRHLRSSDVLIELGCGNGRDGMTLADRVARYVGIDACSIAIEAFSRALDVNGLNGHRPPELLVRDFTATDFNEFSDEASRLALYSRFSLHSITYGEQEQLMQNLLRIRAPWMFMLEARTIFDDLYGVGKNVGLHEFETDHYRRFIDPSAFLQDVSSRFAVKYFEVSDGFAVYKHENPILMRAVIEAKQDSTPR